MKNAYQTVSTLTKKRRASVYEDELMLLRTSIKRTNQMQIAESVAKSLVLNC